MSYKTFESDHAEYALVYAKHVMGFTDEDIFEVDKIGDLDAIVLELSTEPISDKFVGPRGSKRLPFEGKNMYGNDQYGLIIQNVKEAAKGGESIPIFIGDCDLRPLLPSLAAQMVPSYARNIGLRKLTKQVAKKLPAKYRGIFTLVSQGMSMVPEMMPMAWAFAKGEKGGKLDQIVATAGMIPPTPVMEFRNALIASKLEDYLAPKLEAELGRKPRIAVVYGAAHAGIRQDILSKKRRDGVMGLYRKMNYLWFDKPSMDHILELRVDDSGTWTGRDYKTNVK